MVRVSTIGAVALATLVAAVEVRTEPARAIVYNRESKSTAELDRVVEQTYGAKYDVRTIQENDPSYAPAKVLAGRMPKTVLDAAGMPIAGYALVLYLIRDDGSVAEPTVVRSTDVRLEGPAKAALLRAKFAPATWHGKNISIVAGQEFEFDGR